MRFHCYENWFCREGQKPDEEWIAKVDNEAQKKQEKLELELNSYRTNLIRESIRVCLLKWKVDFFIDGS